MDSSDFTESIEHHAAVVVIYHKIQQVLILTKRSDVLKTHPGEICFPGGLKEPSDESLYQTAMRELQEELGIDSSRVTLIKELTTQSTAFGAIIHPWLVSIDELEPYTINPDEVVRILLVPIAMVTNPSNYEDYFVQRGRIRLKSCRFKYNHELIWGATAKIMKQLQDQGELFAAISEQHR